MWVIPLVVSNLSLKSYFVPDFLVWIGFILKNYSFHLRRRDVKVWSPYHLEGFSYKSLFRFLVNFFFMCELIFSLVWRTKVPRKVRFFFW